MKRSAPARYSCDDFPMLYEAYRRIFAGFGLLEFVTATTARFASLPRCGISGIPNCCAQTQGRWLRDCQTTKGLSGCCLGCRPGRRGRPIVRCQRPYLQLPVGRAKHRQRLTPVSGAERDPGPHGPDLVRHPTWCYRVCLAGASYGLELDHHAWSRGRSRSLKSSETR
jgi:hypothetical protein